MGTHVLTNTRLIANNYNVSCDMNSARLNLTAETRDNTNFCGSGWRQYLGGLKSGILSFEGFYFSDSSEAPDPTLRSKIGESLAFSFCPEDYDEGDIGYWGDGILTKFDMSGPIGQIAKLDAEIQTVGTLYRGTVLGYSTAVTTNATTTPVQLGAVGAGETLYAQLHIFSATGTTPTFDVDIQSDDAEAFTNPTTYTSFTQASDVGEEEVSDSTAETDDWWRLNLTVGGTTPSFGYIVIATII